MTETPSSARSPALQASALDVSAITLSSLCLVHCLALPMLGALLPLAATLSEVEWLHRVFVLAALPITLLAIVRSRGSADAALFLVSASAGLVLLLLGAFVEPLHEHEVALTTLGASLLALAHAWRWQQSLKCARSSGGQARD